MSDFSNNTKTKAPRSIWMRGLLMILLAMTYQLASALLCFVAIIQFVLALVNNTPNPRLMSFGRSLGRYQSQNANFVSFATEELPFPFTDWPTGD